MRKMKLGVIGCGDMAKVHLKSLATMDDVTVTALADVSAERLDEAARCVAGRKPKRFSDYHDLLATGGVDGVLVTLPNFLHLEAGVAALRQGVHVFMEKPLARTTAECGTLLQCAAERGLVLQTGLILRYFDVFTKAADLFAEGSAGKPALFQVKIFRPNFPHRWRYSQELSGGALTEKCCHYFDLFNWWTGATPEAVMAVGGQKIIRQGRDYKVYCPPTEEFTVNDSTIIDHSLVNVLYPDGVKANVATCLFVNWQAGGSSLQIEVVTDTGCRVEIMEDQLTIRGRQDTPEVIKVDEKGKSAPAARQLREFIACIREKREPITSAKAGLDSVRVAELAEKSIQENGRMQYF